MNKNVEVLIGDKTGGGAAEAQRLFENYREYAEMEHLYNAAIRQLTIKFEILNDEFKVKYERSPIHHIESRVKTAASIVNKLLSRGAEISCCAGINFAESFSSSFFSSAAVRYASSKPTVFKPQSRTASSSLDVYGCSRVTSRISKPFIARCAASR